MSASGAGGAPSSSANASSAKTSNTTSDRIVKSKYICLFLLQNLGVLGIIDRLSSSECPTVFITSHMQRKGVAREGFFIFLSSKTFPSSFMCVCLLCMCVSLNMWVSSHQHSDLTSSGRGLLILYFTFLDGHSVFSPLLPVLHRRRDYIDWVAGKHQHEDTASQIYIYPEERIVIIDQIVSSFCIIVYFRFFFFFFFFALL